MAINPVEDVTANEALDGGSLRDLIACPHCDALYRLRVPEIGQRAVCGRCHTVLIAPKRKAGRKIIALALSVLILLVSALFFPFLRLHVSGFSNHISILDSALAFRSGAMAFLSLVTGGLIVFVPIAQTLLIMYVVAPVVFDRSPLPHAKAAFRLSQELKPWAMAEIFAIGCAVALVKVADLAQIEFGPAFWMFAVLVLIVLLNDNFLCTWSVWRSLGSVKE